jgi:hypothetical protein
MDMPSERNDPQTSAENKKDYLGARPDLMICTVRCKISTKKEKANEKGDHFRSCMLMKS